jgi:hypothetical protein
MRITSEPAIHAGWQRVASCCLVCTGVALAVGYVAGRSQVPETRPVTLIPAPVPTPQLMELCVPEPKATLPGMGAVPAPPQVQPPPNAEPAVLNLPSLGLAHVI